VIKLIRIRWTRRVVSVGKILYTQDFSWKFLMNRRELFGDIGSGKIMLKFGLKETGYDGVDWILVAQNMRLWRIPVSTAMKFPFRCRIS
jgi:hypothetical protein